MHAVYIYNKPFTHIRTYIHTRIHTLIPIYVSVYIHTYILIYIIYTNTCILLWLDDPSGPTPLHR
jgi:hypothetical protein